MIRILVIESELRARHALKFILEGAGYEVDLAADGVEAERRHSSSPADLVIADYLESTVRLPGAPMLAVPGGCLDREAEGAERARALGAQHFLPKPFRRDDLLAAVRITLEMPPSTQHRL
jgi:DNA-binding response OmpR family regulator